MLTAGEIADMRETAESSFMDACRIGAPSTPAWGSDPGGLTYTYGAAEPCGFDPTPAGEVEDGTQTPLVDAKLRLPIGTVISELYRVSITARHGTAVTAETYVVEGAPRRGPSALVCDLKRITGASAL